MFQEIERLLELMNEEERNLYDQLDFLTASQRGSEARERQSQHDIVRVAIDGSPIEEDTKGNLKSEVGAEVDEEILDQAKVKPVDIVSDMTD